MGYRVIRMSLEVANSIIATGALYSDPENVPRDLKIVDARVTPIGDVGGLELLVFSSLFPPDVDRPVRPITCGKASPDDWRAPEFVLIGRYAGKRITPCLV